MNIVAVMTFRNEAPYLANALRHLQSEGIRFFLVDNQSVDGSADICHRKEFSSYLIGLDSLPADVYFDLSRQLEHKMAIIEKLDADWVIHVDADEIMQSPQPDETLLEGITRVDGEGYTVINFNEFVFLPLVDSYRPESGGPQSIRSYYFHEPEPRRLMRAWKKSAGLSMTTFAGHKMEGENVRLAPENFILRHYMFRDQSHAYAKYSNRRFGPRDVARGWHGNRINVPPAAFQFPEAHHLQWLDDGASRLLDTSRPRSAHYWSWPSAVFGGVR